MKDPAGRSVLCGYKELGVGGSATRAHGAERGVEGEEARDVAGP